MRDGGVDVIKARAVLQPLCSLCMLCCCQQLLRVLQLARSCPGARALTILSRILTGTSSAMSAAYCAAAAMRMGFSALRIAPCTAALRTAAVNASSCRGPGGVGFAGRYESTNSGAAAWSKG